MINNPLPEQLCWGEAEDVTWSKMLKLGSSHILAFNIHSITRVIKPNKESIFIPIPINALRHINRRIYQVGYKFDL